MMIDALLNVLAIAPGPQTATELCDSLRRHHQKLEEFEVLGGFRILGSFASKGLAGGF